MAHPFSTVPLHRKPDEDLPPQEAPGFKASSDSINELWNDTSWMIPPSLF